MFYIAFFPLFQQITIFINVCAILAPILASFFMLFEAWGVIFDGFLEVNKIIRNQGRLTDLKGHLTWPGPPPRPPIYARGYLTIT